jgi:RNA polymerase sigma-70 factor (ECF subfamily)
LLERFAARRGEQDEAAELAFAALLTRHGPMAIQVCRAVLGDRHEVEDAFEATFLALAVRAGSIRRRGSVASWLHGVALRVAAAERARAARRQRHERLRAAMTSAATNGSGNDRVVEHEQGLAIQEEIARLPEEHRAAVVLCYLEGLTHEMAAQQLGWPVGSMRSGLAWARDRLRIRLARRGLAPVGFPADPSGSPRDAESSPGPVVLGIPLAETTLRGALRAGMGREALIRVVSAEAIDLMEGVVRSMTNGKLMLVATAVLVAGLATTVACLAGSPARRGENDSPRSEVRPWDGTT